MAHGRSLLVNFVYCHPVGHAIEALHYCHGHHRADPGVRIGLALNAGSPAELAAGRGAGKDPQRVAPCQVLPGYLGLLSQEATCPPPSSRPSPRRGQARGSR